MKRVNRTITSYYIHFVAVLFLCLLQMPARAAELAPAIKAQLHRIIGQLEQAGAQVGLEIDDLGTVSNAQQFPAPTANAPKVLFSYRATQRFMSASNWKLFTAYYALNSPVPDNARDTRIFLVTARDESGNAVNDILLKGYGDPSLTIEQLRDAARAMKAKGIVEIGDVVGDGSHFGAETLGGRYPFGWTLDDALWYYAPPVGALAINRNQVDVQITSGKNPGDAAVVSYSPDLPDLAMTARVSTGSNTMPKGSSALQWNRFEKGREGFSVTGLIAPQSKISEGIALSDPALMAAKVLLREMQNGGIAVRGTAQNADEWKPRIVDKTSLFVIPAPPLKVLLARMLKRSDNLYAEMILRSSSTNPAAGVDGIRAQLWPLLRQNGVDVTGLRMEDGAGLSRYSLITPRATVQLLAAAQKLPAQQAQVFWDSLPIAGVDGTLARRMKRTFAQNNVRAKTGTFSTATTLSGYVTTRDGRRLAVSFLINFGPDEKTTRTAQDTVFALLAAMKAGA